ncbi:hypothetical protein B0H11DRAFT_1937471 [Mycena galericulata]|nr:hypothetical protein B0H11DRAFT_1937471 [Mycena galericulata]
MGLAYTLFSFFLASVTVSITSSIVDSGFRVNSCYNLTRRALQEVQPLLMLSSLLNAEPYGRLRPQALSPRLGLGLEIIQAGASRLGRARYITTSETEPEFYRGILKSQQIFGSRDYAWNQGMVPAPGGPTRAFGLRGSRSRASVKGSRVPTPFKCANLHDAFMANREQQIFIFSQLIPSISKLLTDPGQVDYTRLTWMHLDEAEIYEKLKTEDFALLALREDTLTTFTKDKLFPTLYDLRKSLEILQITKEAWIAGSSPELYNFLSDCANRLSTSPNEAILSPPDSSGGAASPSNGNPGVSPPVPSGSRVRLGMVRRMVQSKAKAEGEEDGKKPKHR